jgi:hypothetical protein
VKDKLSTGVALANHYADQLAASTTEDAKECVAIAGISDLGPAVEKFFSMVMALLCVPTLSIGATFPPPHFSVVLKYEDNVVRGEGDDLEEAFKQALEIWRK